MDAVAHLLVAAFRHSIDEPNIDAGFERLQSITGNALDAAQFHDAVAACLRDGLIHEPVRLPDGALQCHWHLELTPKGDAAARALIG
jgi:hypothetical protein